MKAKQVLIWVTPANAPRLNGIARYAKSHGWNLTITDRLGRRPIGWHGDGALTTMRGGSGMANYVKELRRHHIPVVDLSLNHPEISIPRVSGDHLLMGRLAGEHFRDRNFRHAAWFSTSWLNIHALRYKGFTAGFGETPLKWTLKDEIPDRQRDDFRVISKWLTAKLKAAPKPLAVLGYDDADAARILSVALDAGLSVPEDVAILGIGDDTLVCEHQAVPLSSIAHDQERTGYDGAALLDRLMNGERELEREIRLIPPLGITVRASTDRMAVSSPILRQSLSFIKQNLSRPFGIDQIAEAVGASRATLDRLFQAELNRSAGKEILRQRIALAKTLLDNESLSIATVAAECGFCNQAYLANVFLRETGMTPSKWRTRQNPQNDRSGVGRDR